MSALLYSYPTKRQSLTTNLQPSGSLCPVATKSHKNVQIFRLLQSVAPQPGPCLLCAENVWRSRVEEEAGNACPPNGPITVLVVCVASVCCYTFEEVHAEL